MRRPIRVVIIAPHDLSRNGLEALLSRAEDRVRLVGSYREVEPAESALAQLAPQVILVDDSLPPTDDIGTVLLT